MIEGELYTGQQLKTGWTTKINGRCEEIIIKDPDCYDEETGFKIKVRKKHTNITPKKKKRKK